MSKKNYKAVIIVLIIINLILLYFVAMNYIFNHNYGEWIREYLLDDKYLILINEKDRDEYWIGNREIEVYIKDLQNEVVMNHFNTTIDNNGSPLTNNNYFLECNNDYISLKFFEADGDLCGSYRFYFEDYLC